jgi:tRNA nucleotidyltransferase (CCA-adding enzyme)
MEELGNKILELVKKDPAARVAVERLSPHGEVYVVGGAPRDVVLGKNPKDIDLMARIDGKVIEDVLSEVPRGSVVLTGKQFPVYRFKYADSEVEIALPRTESKSGEGNKDWDIVFGPEITVEQDLERRDFTVNAIAVNAVTGEVVDPFGGINDLTDGKIRTVSETSFRDDSSRVMRALTQMSKHGLVPDDMTKEQMRSFAEHLTNTTPELIQKELDKILDGGNPHLAIRLAYETGVLQHFLPEVFEAFGFDQMNKHHSLELGEHLLAVLEGALASDDPDVRLAALLHDIGKPGSQWIDDEGYAHYYKKQLDDGSFLGEMHEELGADMARERMRALKYPNERIENVDFLIRNHMFPAFTNARGARKFLQNAGSYERAMKLLDLRNADLGGKGRGLTQNEVNQSVQKMRDLVTQEYENQNAVSLKDLAINGRDVMDATGVQGPEIGRKLKALLDMVVEDPSLNNRETLLGLVKTAMAERTGDPELDAAIEEYLEQDKFDLWYDDETIEWKGLWTKEELAESDSKYRPKKLQDMRKPELAGGWCGVVSIDFMKFMQAKGFDASLYRAKSREDWAGAERETALEELYKDVPEENTGAHCVVLVVHNNQEYTIDWTSAQYVDEDNSKTRQFSEFPLIQRLNKRYDKWQNKWSKVSNKPELDNLSMIYMQVPELSLDTPKDVHLTLFTFEDATEEELAKIEEIVSEQELESVSAKVTHFELFGENKDTLVAIVDAHGLHTLYDEIGAKLNEAGIEYKNDYDFKPHITLEWGFEGELPETEEIEFELDTIAVAQGDCSNSNNVRMEKTSMLEYNIPYGPPKEASLPKRSFNIRRKMSYVDFVTKVFQNSGGTFDPQTLEPVDTPGYYTSYYGTEAKINADYFDESFITRYLQRHAPTFEAHPDSFLGIWVEKDEDGNELDVYLDMSRVFESEEEAIEFAKKNKQKAVYNSIEDSIINV